MRGFLGKEGVTSSNLVISSIQKCSVYGFLHYEEARFFVPRNVSLLSVLEFSRSMCCLCLKRTFSVSRVQ